ncbi:enoyl-CoA hydratase-related protein [Planotetraspora mira]|uniref:enoyl-CoA hydratase-related protein n=1 Tax=Planotetraspora mira TaxID=58121 RepID=UPI0023B28097|nr:enoyl-CoA hydratase-related protein [Planotetraspora mira]
MKLGWIGGGGMAAFLTHSIGPSNAAMMIYTGDPIDARQALAWGLVSALYPAEELLPLLRPVIATATILICLYVWNDIFYSFFVLGGGTYTTLPLNLYSVASSNLYQNNWNLVFAYVVLMSLPLIVIFVVAQRRIIAGITGGAVK